MKKTKRILTVLFLAVLLISALCVPAFALTESEVEAQVAASGKESVTGNVLIWFLCAVAFLKVSQKIDSFMASLGVNVGRTGSSMLAEVMIAARGVSTVAGFAGHTLGRGAANSAGTSKAANSAGASGGFFKGGLIGMAGRKITSSAVRTATTQTSAVHTGHKEGGCAVHTQSAETARTNSTVPSGDSVHTSSTSQTNSTARTDQTTQREGVIITGNNTPPMSPAPADSATAHDSGIHPDPTVPQEGVVLTSSEVQTSSTTQMEGRTDSVLQQEGVIQTGSEYNSHSSHSSSERASSETVRQGGVEGRGGSERHTASQARSVETTHHRTHSAFPVRMPTLGGKIFSHSLQSGGRFANDVIGMVARGDMRSTGSITGDLAAQSLQSYMGHTALGTSAAEKVSYSQVEIGGGRITGREVTPEHLQGIEFAMYHVEQYARPEGDYQKVFSADGAAWYKQHAVDTVAKTPFKAPDGEIDYQKEIVKRLPTPPKRKDRM